MEEINFNYMGPMLKAARKKIELTQDQLAERIGVTTRYIMAIENEGKCPALDVWFRLVRALHTSADAIVYPENQATVDEDQRIVLMLRLLCSRDKNIVKAVIQAMLENRLEEAAVTSPFM